MIHLIAVLARGPGRCRVFLGGPRGLLPEILAEGGCIRHAPSGDVGTGITARVPAHPDAGASPVLPGPS